MNCDICGKKFDSYRKLNGHKSIHREGGRYSQSRKKIRQEFECLNCNKKFPYNKSSVNKYCSTTCFGEASRKITLAKIESGQKVGKGSIKMYLLEKCNFKCESCGIGESWNNKHLTLQLDHIDGNSDNNVLSNLRILCPNCHTQTETYGSRGQGSRYQKNTKRNSYLREYKARLV